MFIHEAIYDLDELAHYNLHMHTHYSNCAKPEMTIENIIAEAEKCGIETISLNDHLRLPEDCKELFEHNSILRQQVEKTGTKINVLIGGEFSSYGIDKYTLKGVDYKPDYRLYAANHYHVDGWEHPDERSPDGYKEHMKKMLEVLFQKHEADCIAHPIYGRFSAKFLDDKYGHDVPTIGKAWSDNELGDILVKGFQSGCAWEINAGAVLGDPEFFRRFFNIGREAGVIFNFGTDAHRLINIDTHTHLDELKRILL